jgi:asparagine synthase (glutamine-hydrolysing)
MSGIAGIIRFDGAPVDRSLIEKMTGAMGHRGPDGISHWVKGSVALGQCMLRTTPESFEEEQPLANEDESLVLVMDGRVDNWEELRSELLSCGARLRTRADAELVLRAYEQWSRDCLKHIDGDFALVIWDERRREVFCARDRMGSKPLIYRWDGSTFMFASEVRPLVAPGKKKEELNEGLIAEFLANEWLSRDQTFCRGIYRLVAAHQMVVGAAGKSSFEYWRPDLTAMLPYSKRDDFVQHYLDLLHKAVRRASRSHVRLAFEVSGGLDSSALFVVADHLFKQRKLLAPDFDGYTLRFDQDSKANELEYARLVGAHVNRPVREIEPSRMPLDWYRRLAANSREFPGYPNGVMGGGIRNEARARGSRVLISGIGGDQWLCGSRSYYSEEIRSRRWYGLWNCFSSDRQEVGSITAAWWILRHGLYPMMPDRARALIRKKITGEKLFGIDTKAWLLPQMRKLLDERLGSAASSQALSGRTVGQRELFLTLRSAFSIFTRELEERFASSTGIELRYPFFCRDMVQFAFSTQLRWRLAGTTDKLIHRSAMDGYLPEAVRMRGDKAEFTNTFVQYSDSLTAFLGESDIATGWVDKKMLTNRCFGWKTSEQASIEAWLLWTLFGCTGLLEDRSCVAVEK